MELWDNESELPGVTIDQNTIINLLNSLVYHKFEYDDPNNKERLRYHPNNLNYGPVDIEIYYSMIRHMKPNKIIEIGSVESTFIASFALEKNRVFIL